MSQDKKILYITSVATLAALVSLFFIKLSDPKIATALVLAAITPIVWFTVKKRAIPSISKREVFVLSVVLAVILSVLIEISGIYFGYRKNPYFVNSDSLLRSLLPISVIIITTEVIRYVFLSQKSVFVDVLTFLGCVVAEALTITNIHGISTFNRFMDLFGMTLFPALVANVYYHYVSKRYGPFPNIALRLIMSGYIYFIPQSALMSDALRACIKLVIPILLLALVSALFEKKKRYAMQKGKKATVISTAITLLILVSIMMLISCQFRFGAIVIATESMTGEINKGDIIIYERYDDQVIKEGQVIVFQYLDKRVIHRVVKIEHVGGETRYYTKGDANNDLDFEYRLDENIIGLTDVKVAYAGYPTLWLRELLNSGK